MQPYFIFPAAVGLRSTAPAEEALDCIHGGVGEGFQLVPGGGLLLQDQAVVSTGAGSPQRD